MTSIAKVVAQRNQKQRQQLQSRSSPALQPPTESKEWPLEEDVSALETKASSIRTPGGLEQHIIEIPALTPGGPHPAHKEQPARPSTSITTTSTAQNTGNTPKRKFEEDSTSKTMLTIRRPLFPPRKKLKDASLITITKPDDGNTNKKPQLTCQPDFNFNKGLTQQPTSTRRNHQKPMTPTTDQEFTSTLISFRDDIINQMVNLHVKTAEQLEKQLDLLKAQNQALNKKLERIINTLPTSHRIPPSHKSPTPPCQLPPFLLPDEQPQPAKKPPPPPPVERGPRSTSRNTEDNSMSIEQTIIDSLPSTPHNNPNQSKRQDPNPRIKHSEREPEHFNWMREEFKKCFGLPTDSYKRRSIYSFDGVLLADGYNKVVPTWQGLYFELKGEDIAFGNLDRNFSTARGTTTWSTKGVEIFKLHREDLRTTPRPHRFAVVPSGRPSEPCNPLTVGKFYCHVYQTKLQLATNFRKALNSKAMAKSLKQRLGIQYLPRPRDLPTDPQQVTQDRTERLNQDNPMYHNKRPQSNGHLRNPETFPPQNQSRNYPQRNDPHHRSNPYRNNPYNQARRVNDQTVFSAPMHTFPLINNPPPFPFDFQANHQMNFNQCSVSPYKPPNWTLATTANNQHLQIPWQLQQPYQPTHLSSYQNPQNPQYPPGLQPQPNFANLQPQRDLKTFYQEPCNLSYNQSYPVEASAKQHNEQAINHYQQPYVNAPRPPGVNYK